MGARPLERLVPKRLGRDFRRLLAATWLSNTGDGIALAAGPLLVASLTDNPALIASAAADRPPTWRSARRWSRMRRDGRPYAG